MDTPSAEEDSKTAPERAAKWLERIATLEAESRDREAKLAVVRSLVERLYQDALSHDVDGEPCWCSATTSHDIAPHNVACYLLRRFCRRAAGEVL